jgi:hypothetical protein
LVAPVRTYSAPPVAGSFIATAAASSSCRTYAHTHRTKPNLGRACASLAGAKPDAYGSCTARRAERGSAERLKDRLALDRARRRAGLIKRVSGSKPLQVRREGKRLLAALRPGDLVITSKLDRMFRSGARRPRCP